ncbi:MAG: sucrose synthase [Candidatus Sedimenticola endophacoides]
MTLPQRFLRELEEYLRDHRNQAHRVWHHLHGMERNFLLRSDLQDAFADLVAESDQGLSASPIARLIGWCQEAALNDAWIYLALRTRVARWNYLRIHVDTMAPEPIDVSVFLHFKEQLADGYCDDEWALEIDLEPFSRELYKLHEAHSIGKGVEFLNRRLSSRLFEDLGKGDRRLLQFLRAHRWRRQQLMLSEQITDTHELRHALRLASDLLEASAAQTPWSELSGPLRALGFEPGWGNRASRIRQTMQLLQNILEAPDPENIERFLARVPMIFSVAILSPHGWFGQADVLGRPDTGGQVVYILDQVRALEKEMLSRIADQGLEIEPQIRVITRLIPEAEGTSCDQRSEAIAGTHHARILRVPFRDGDGSVLPHWISRFEIWPYLERFTVDCERELLAELGGRPDLIIGNYSDGNLVASLLSRRLRVTQCNIAHALEKTKYLYSDLYWRANEALYHFSCQFTADLIAMNAADFIITSTYQEIAGTAESAGQYEAHGAFTMPGLYRVVHGIDVFDPKFNIVSPGADPEVYFPSSDTERRHLHLLDEIERLVLSGETGGDIRGALTEPDKPLLFSMARLDRIKNITGLVRWYAESPELRTSANLLLVSGHVDPSRSDDAEEREQIELMHQLMDHHQLDGQVRWIGRHLKKDLAGELYRFVADQRGAFVQPALFEAFGLTVIEAMSTGLPTFATCFGGPMEIIENGVSGFHIDPNHGTAAADKLADFFACCREAPNYWVQISNGALHRVESRYTWARYAERLMTLSRIYGFWKYVTDLERAETHRYLEMLYSLQFRQLAKTLRKD